MYITWYRLIECGLSSYKAYAFKEKFGDQMKVTKHFVFAASAIVEVDVGWFAEKFLSSYGKIEYRRLASKIWERYSDSIEGYLRANASKNRAEHLSSDDTTLLLVEASEFRDKRLSEEFCELFNAGMHYEGVSEN